MRSRVKVVVVVCGVWCVVVMCGPQVTRSAPSAVWRRGGVGVAAIWPLSPTTSTSSGCLTTLPGNKNRCSDAILVFSPF